MPTKECKHETYTHGPKREGYKVFVCVACNQLIHRETPWDDWKLLKENYHEETLNFIEPVRSQSITSVVPR